MLTLMKRFLPNSTLEQDGQIATFIRLWTRAVALPLGLSRLPVSKRQVLLLQNVEMSAKLDLNVSFCLSGCRRDKFDTLIISHTNTYRFLHG